MVTDFEAPFEITGYTLHLECWGWYGLDIKYLGSLDHNDGAPILGEAVAIGSSLSADLVLEQLDGDMTGFGFGGDFVTDIGVDIADIEFKSLMPPDMVFLSAYVTTIPELCRTHLPPEFQNLFGIILFCFPYPGFHGGEAEGNNPQPYLVWDFLQDCVAGTGTEQGGGPCKSYSEYLQQAAANKGRVGFYVHDHSDAGYSQWIVDAPNLRNFTIPPNGCTDGRSFFEQMWYLEDGFTQTGPMSNQVTIPCPKPVGNVITLDFTFENLTLHNLDDDDSGAQTVEVFGYFQVKAPSSQLGNNNFLKMGDWWEQWSECPDDTDYYFTSSPPGSCTQRFTNGTHNMADIPLCKSSDRSQDNKFHCWASSGNSTVQDNYHSNNNTLRIEVMDGDGITLLAKLHDWDDSSPVDLVCFAIGNDLASGKNLFEWDAMDGQVFALLSFGDDGMNCNISGTIHVVE